MAKISHRVKILLGYNPKSLSNSSSRRDSEVDFSDVFGGPPRCSSSNNEIDDDDDNNINSIDEGDDDGIWFGLMEKPVFGDQIGVQKGYLSDDFYDDIFFGDQTLMGSSLPPKVHMPGRSPFLSTPGSRDISPSRPSSVVEPSASPSNFSLSERVISTDIMNSTMSTSINQNLKSFGRSLPRYNHTLPNHSTLNGDEAHSSHKPSSLSRQNFAYENKLTCDSIVRGTADQHEAEFVDLKGSEFANDMQFHFSIYKWANKGIPIDLTSRRTNPSRFKERMTSDAMFVMEDNKGCVNVNVAVSLSKRRMSFTPQARGLEHSNDIVAGGISVAYNLEDVRVEDPTNEVGEARHKGLVGVKEVLVHPEKGLDAKSLKYFAKMRQSSTKPLRALFGEEKEGNYKAAAEKGRKQNMVNEPKKSSLKKGVFSRANRKSKVHESTRKKDVVRKNDVAGKVKDYVRNLNQDFSTPVKSNVMGQNSKSRWKGKTMFEVKKEFNTFPTESHDEMQDSYVNLPKTWPESIEVVDGEAFLSVEQEFTINESANVSGSASNDEPKTDGLRPSVPKSTATSVDDNLLYERKVRQWSKGKERNIRALLSTMQNVLWPNSGWKPVPLVDIIEANSVKRAYQRALLCLHPDKLQQKGAAPYQKLIAEKIFDILQEAWDEFNSLGML